MPAMAAELVRSNLDVIVAGGTQTAQAAKEATREVPLVIWGGDLLATGLIDNLSRPGGNATGITSQVAELQGKTVSLVRDVVPNVRRVAVLINDVDPLAPPFLGYVQAATNVAGLALVVVRSQGTAEPEGVFSAIHAAGAEAAILQASSINAVVKAAADEALRYRLPSFSNAAPFAANGGLVSLGASRDERGKRIAYYVDLILKGAKPGELPVEQSSLFDVVVNLKTAKALGITIPPTLLVQATELIQ
jgi:putative ABC transport system substrate-binding protein